MAPGTRTTCYDARLPCGLVGTMVTTYDLVPDGALPGSTSPALPVTPSALATSPMTTISTSSQISRTWVITEKISERAAPMDDHDIKMGYGSAKTVGKFLCHLAEDPTQIAFMRIYYQIPITGTEDADHDTLATQAVPPGVCGELESFKLPQSEHCSAVPRILCHAESTQGDDSLVPGGYIRYVVWEKVPGSL